MASGKGTGRFGKGEVVGKGLKNLRENTAPNFVYRSVR